MSTLRFCSIWYPRWVIVVVIGTTASILLTHSYLAVEMIPSRIERMPVQSVGKNSRIAIGKRAPSFQASEERYDGMPQSSYEAHGQQHNEIDFKSFQLTSSSCNMDNCFHYKRCPITEPLKFYLHPLPDEKNQSQISFNNRNNSLYSVLRMNGQRVDDPEIACISIFIVQGCYDFSLRTTKIAELYEEGKNHVIWTYCDSANSVVETPTRTTRDMMPKGIPSSAIFITDVVDREFRLNFDVLAGHVPRNLGQIELSPLFPLRKKYLASIVCCDKAAVRHFLSFAGSLRMFYRSVTEGNECGDETLRTNLLRNSTFSFLILPPDDTSLRQGRNLQRQLHEMFKLGVIPVVIGTRFLPPFSTVLDWSKVMITIPPGRISEVRRMLQSISDEDILVFKKNGRLLFDKYLSSLEAIADTVLSVLRTRIGLVPTPYEDAHSPSVYNDTFKPRKKKPVPIQPKNKKNLGPFPARPKASPKFKSNFTFNFLRKYDAWNTYHQPFKLYPCTPWDDSLPNFPYASTVSETSWNQNGMPPQEQFTIVMLTYKRETVLMQTLQRLYPLPYLNKIVIVWNTPYPPPGNLTWPDIKVSIEIIRPERNSLNNRFLPFDTIETQAVMSLDDDSPLQPEEIVFGFRVWLENKDRIVGYPARLHKWDWRRQSWNYQPTDHCQISLVLTGAAFFHKIYMYKYTYEMPSAIRHKVDELMNCEDVAMNFLIAHVTQKPPIKVTNKRNFECRGCKTTLSKTGKHYDERSNCIRFFEKVYGYMPLRYTVSRTDSILFGVRNPKHSNPPCFTSV